MKNIEEIKNKLDEYSLAFYRLSDILIKIDENFPMQAHNNIIINDSELNGSILDIGCGFCETDIVLKLKRPELDIHCMEGSRINCKIALELAEKANVKLNIYNACVEEYPNISNIKFDCIICSNTIEHIEDPYKFMDYIIYMLKPNGILYLTMPYADCHYSTEHVNFFITDNIPEFVEGNDLIRNTKNCIKLEEFLIKFPLDGECRIFNEELSRLGHESFKSNDQLDIILKLRKKNE